MGSDVGGCAICPKALYVKKKRKEKSKEGRDVMEKESEL
jgi:hypothetical protein